MKGNKKTSKIEELEVTIRVLRARIVALETVVKQVRNAVGPDNTIIDFEMARLSALPLFP